MLSAGTGNLVELFAGSRSIGKVGDELGMNVFSVDWQNFENINLAIDIGEMKTSDVPFIPDVVWASPDCTTFMLLGIWTVLFNKLPVETYGELILGIFIGVIIVVIYHRFFGIKALKDAKNEVIQEKQQTINFLSVMIGQKLTEVNVDPKDKKFFVGLKRYFKNFNKNNKQN